MNQNKNTKHKTKKRQRYLALTRGRNQSSDYHLMEDNSERMNVGVTQILEASSREKTTQRNVE